MDGRCLSKYKSLVNATQKGAKEFGRHFDEKKPGLTKFFQAEHK